MLIGYELLEEHVGVIMGQVLEVNDADFDMVTTVSYTHLTLPTKA